jgi:hypothetical protein
VESRRWFWSASDTPRSRSLDLYSHVIGTLQEDAATRLDLAFDPAIRPVSLASKKVQ